MILTASAPASPGTRIRDARTGAGDLDCSPGQRTEQVGRVVAVVFERFDRAALATRGLVLPVQVEAGDFGRLEILGRELAPAARRVVEVVFGPMVCSSWFAAVYDSPRDLV